MRLTLDETHTSPCTSASKAAELQLFNQSIQPACIGCGKPSKHHYVLLFYDQTVDVSAMCTDNHSSPHRHELPYRRPFPPHPRHLARCPKRSRTPGNQRLSHRRRVPRPRVVPRRTSSEHGRLRTELLHFKHHRSWRELPRLKTKESTSSRAATQPHPIQLHSNPPHKTRRLVPPPAAEREARTG